MRPKVYVAGPYTSPDPERNTKRALQAADSLWDLGFAPFVPHLSHYWHQESPKPYEVWMEYDNEFLPICDAVFRLCGHSPGADDEVNRAEALDIPVFYEERNEFDRMSSYFSMDRKLPSTRATSGF